MRTAFQNAQESPVQPLSCTGSFLKPLVQIAIGKHFYEKNTIMTFCWF